MKIKNLIFALTIGCICLSSCGNNDLDFQPGEDDPEGFVQVYFNKAKLSEKTTPNEPLELSVIVSRLDSASEIEVPLEVTCDLNAPFSVPTTVKFAAGEKESVITIPFAATEEKGEYNCSISITDPLYNGQYTSLNTKVDLTVVVSEITMINNMDDLIGSYSARTTGQDYFNYVWAAFDYQQTITFVRGDDDETVIMSGLFWEGDCPLNGKVDFSKQTITFEQQDWYGYNFCAYNWNSETNSFETGKPVIAKIKPNGEIVLDDFCCTYDWEENGGLYYYLYDTSATLTKNMDVIGTYNCVTSGSDYWNYEWATFAYEQEVTFTQGNDENTVIMNGLYWEGVCQLTGTINPSERTITFAEQPWGSSDYMFCGYAWDLEKNVFKTGEPVIATVKFNGEIEINNYCCTYDWGGDYGIYYYLWNTSAILRKAE